MFAIAMCGRSFQDTGSSNRVNFESLSSEIQTSDEAKTASVDIPIRTCATDRCYGGKRWPCKEKTPRQWTLFSGWKGVPGSWSWKSQSCSTRWPSPWSQGKHIQEILLLIREQGVNIMDFCKKYNAATADKIGQIIPVEITVYEVPQYYCRWIHSRDCILGSQLYIRYKDTSSFVFTQRSSRSVNTLKKKTMSVIRFRD